MREESKRHSQALRNPFEVKTGGRMKVDVQPSL